MATEPQTTFHTSRFTLHEMRAQKPLFMQNKAKSKKARMNVSAVLTKYYDNWTLGQRGKNKPKTNPNKPKSSPKQAKTNPIKPNLIN